MVRRLGVTSSDLSIKSAYNAKLDKGQYHAIIIGHPLYTLMLVDLSWNKQRTSFVNSPLISGWENALEHEKDWPYYYDNFSTDSNYGIYEPPKKEKKTGEYLCIKLWRKGLYLGDGPVELCYNTSTSQDNVLILDLSHYPQDLDYTFFDEVQAVIKGNNLIFLDDNNKFERTHYSIYRRNMVRISRRTIVKKFKRQ